MAQRRADGRKTGSSAEQVDGQRVPEGVRAGSRQWQTAEGDAAVQDVVDRGRCERTGRGRSAQKQFPPAAGGLTGDQVPGQHRATLGGEREE